MLHRSTALLLLATLGCSSLPEIRELRRTLTGVPAPLHIFDSRRDGPTVAVVSGMRGKAPAANHAALQLLEWRITRGRLIVLTDGDGADTEELAALLAREQPDWLVELHDTRYDKDTVPWPLRRSVSVFSRSTGERMIDAANTTIEAETEHYRLESREPPALLTKLVAALGCRLVTIESHGQMWLRSSDARHHRLMVHRLLADLGMISHGPDVLVNRKRHPEAVAIAMFFGAEAMASRLGNYPERLFMGRLGEDDVKLGLLEQFDVLYVPGGEANRQTRVLGVEGRDAIRRFVASGGGYVGHCAGAYLASCFPHYATAPWLEIIDARPDRDWARGTGAVTIELTEQGRRILGDHEGEIEIWYGNGPVLRPGNVERLVDYTPLAYYRSEKRREKSPQKEGVMIDTTAVAASPYGKGRVLISSPHSDFDDRFNELVLREMLWAAGRIE